MKPERVSVNIEYRVTVPKTDGRNICQDRRRDDGFYWTEAQYYPLEYGSMGRGRKESKEHYYQQMARMFEGAKSLDELTLEDILDRLDKVEVPADVEGIKVEVLVMYDSETGTVNGCMRKYAELKLFADIDWCRQNRPEMFGFNPYLK